MPRGRKPAGEQALSNAERQARHRACHAAPPSTAIVRPRPPADRRSRPQRWRDAVNELIALQAGYADWLTALPDSLRDSKAAERIASHGMLPGVDLLPHLKCSRPGFGGHGHEADQHGNAGRVDCGGIGALRPSQPGRTWPHPGRVHGGDGIASQARGAPAARRGAQPAVRAAAGAAGVQHRRARGADRGVGGVGPSVRQAVASVDAVAARCDGAARSSSAGGGGAWRPVVDERCDDRPGAASDPRAGGRRDAPSGSGVVGSTAQRSGSDVCRLGRPGAGVHGGGPGGA